MKKLFLLLGCLLVLGSAPAWAQTTPQVVTVQVEETGVVLYITTAEGTAPAQTQRLYTQKRQDFRALAAEQYQQLLTTYYQKGYVLQHIVSGRRDGSSSTSTLLFIKPKT